MSANQIKSNLKEDFSDVCMGFFFFFFLTLPLKAREEEEVFSGLIEMQRYQSLAFAG